MQNIEYQAFAISLISNNQYPLCIQTIKDLLTLGYVQANNDTDFWDELNESQRQSITLSIQQLEAGEEIPHNQVMADMRKMLAK